MRGDHPVSIGSQPGPSLFQGLPVPVQSKKIRLSARQLHEPCCVAAKTESDVQIAASSPWLDPFHHFVEHDWLVIGVHVHAPDQNRNSKPLPARSSMTWSKFSCMALRWASNRS